MKRTCTIAAILLSAAAVWGQALKFEVASVKKVESGSPPGDIPRNMETTPGNFAMRNVALRFAIEWAWDLKDFEIAGPDWIKGEERYDIIAKAGRPASENEMRQMLQALLVERFQMKLRRETKELPVYVLLPGKGEAKVRPAKADEKPMIAGGGQGTTFTAFPISRFTFMLTRRMDRPVLDQTGLKGTYTYTIDLSGLGFAGRPAERQEGEAGPSIFTTVQRDLGLKLEARKEPISMLVLDAANKVPIEN
ncbi:MAG TPA: TIGR03435 family protein [Candidatus Solibacter sp.]|nr:TIGR03435 family protein [Candidatus Solibacter sp.]